MLSFTEYAKKLEYFTDCLQTLDKSSCLYTTGKENPTIIGSVLESFTSIISNMLELKRIVVKMQQHFSKRILGATKMQMLNRCPSYMQNGSLYFVNRLLLVIASKIRNAISYKISINNELTLQLSIVFN